MRSIQISLSIVILSLAMNAFSNPPNNAYAVFIVDTLVEDACEISAQHVNLTLKEPNAKIHVTCTLTTPYVIYPSQEKQFTYIGTGLTQTHLVNQVNIDLYY